jgi:chaperone required for assembly of F1-ATPase
MSGPSNGESRKPGQEPPRPLPKRFYKTVGVETVVPSPLVGDSRAVTVGAPPTPNPSPPGGGEKVGHRLLLDGKPVRTPAKRELRLPTRALAQAIADEWAAQGERIDPASMPLTKLANSSIDGVASRAGEVRAEIVKYAGSDLICYRAEGPRQLMERQAEHWDPVLAWAREAHGAALTTVQGIMPIRQPPAATEAVAKAIASHDPFRLAAIHVMTTLMGSALLALAHAHGRLSAEAAWAAAHVDEDWQISQWGEDAEAKARRDRRWVEMQAASRLLALLR